MRPRTGRGLLAEVACLAALGLAGLGFFWRVVIGSAWVPADGGDLVSFLYPNYAFAAESLKQGIVPLWNPYLYGGMPFAADLQSGILYPPNVILFLLAPALTYRTVQMWAILHIIMAGWAMFICLRGMAWEGHPPSHLAATTGALAYMFADVFLVHVGNLNLNATMAWMPLVILCAQRIAVGSSRRAAIGLSITLALAILAGHVQMILYTLGAIILLWVSNSIGRVPSLQSTVRPTLLMVGGIMGGIGLAAIGLLPNYELAGYSLRSHLSYEEAARYSLPMLQLIGFLVPTFFGRGPASSWGAWDRVETGYVGVLTLVLAVIGLAAPERVMRRWLIILFFASLLVALGDQTVVHGWLYAMGLGFERVRAPARTLVLTSFALAALAAQGLDLLLRPMGRQAHRLIRLILRAAPGIMAILIFVVAPIFYSAVLLAQDKDPVIFRRVVGAANGYMAFVLFAGTSLGLVWLRARGQLKGQALGMAACALLFLDLSATGAFGDLGTQDPSRGYQQAEVIRFLQQQPGPYRIDSRTGVWDIWQPDTGLVYGIQDIGGIANPLLLSHYHEFWENLGSRSSALYDTLNVHYVIGKRDVVLDFQKFVPVFASDGIGVFRNIRAMPRAWVVTRSRRLPPGPATLTALRDPEFDPRQEVILAEGEEMAGAPAQAEAVVVAYEANALTVHVQSDQDGYLILSEVWYPGWRAWCDDRETPVLRADHALRAVAIPAGEHTVRLVFDPTSWRVGMALSVITSLALASVAALALWRSP